jgi:type II secretory pathway pseudopilin PulG
MALPHVERRYRARGGFTLVEAAISTMVVGVMVAAAMNGVAQTSAFRRISNEQQIAHSLAEQLMAEILSKRYWDPEMSSPTPIGPSPAENATGNRSLFNDVDDYHGWIAGPPQAPDGTLLTMEANWYRRVEVAFVHWSNLNVPVASDHGLKRVHVEVGRVRHGGSVHVTGDRRAVTTLVAVAGRGR